MKGTGTISSRLWSRFIPDADVPAFGVFQSNGTTVNQGRVFISGKQYVAGDPKKTIWVNGPMAVKSGHIGYCHDGLGYAAACLGSGNVGQHVGPSEGSWAVSSGQPGFVIIGPGAISGTVMVKREPGPTIARGKLTDSIEPTNGSVSVANISVLSGLEIVSDANTSVTCENLLHLRGENTGNAYFIWNESTASSELLKVEPRAEVIKAVISSAVNTTDNTVSVNGVVTMLPPNALDYTPAINSVRNTFGLAGNTNTTLLACYNKTNSCWEGFWIQPSNAADSAVLWGKVQAGFGNASGATARTVSVKESDWDGQNEAGDPFNLSTPIKANKDTALFTGYVVGYVEQDANKIIITDCWDDPINTIRIVGDDVAIRDGWEEVVAARDRFIKGLAGEGEAYGQTGGAITHTHETHNIHHLSIRMFFCCA